VVRERQHTLALSGRLDHGSAHLLEAEIERMCEDGVTAITLDLRGLGEIDWAGIAVIAFRSAHCNRRGYHLEVIAGSEVLLAALTDAGVEHLVAREALDAAGEAQLQDRLSLG